MQDTTKEFLTKLAALMEEYNAEFEITESCHGYNGFSVDGLEIGLWYATIDGDITYKNIEYVELSGRFHNAVDFRELAEEGK
ncbi:MAG: hypothetical protein Tp178MES00d2C33159851_147 [Prokaryotic dsDNA virus sp.]|nr:MAG: hypothetical protein Tp178MES00d2C33159851_147 [Prokaryotic dsDNA virus sp.]